MELTNRDNIVPLPPCKDDAPLIGTDISITVSPEDGRSMLEVKGDSRTSVYALAEALVEIGPKLRKAAKDDPEIKNWLRTVILLLFTALLGNLEDAEAELNAEIEAKKNSFWPPIIDAMM